MANRMRLAPLTKTTPEAWTLFRSQCVIAADAAADLNQNQRKAAVFGAIQGDCVPLILYFEPLIAAETFVQFLDRLAALFLPPDIALDSLYQFQAARQHPDEPYRSWAMRVRYLAMTGYGLTAAQAEIHRPLIRKVMVGVANTRVSEMAINTNYLTLTAAVNGTQTALSNAKNHEVLRGVAPRGGNGHVAAMTSTEEPADLLLICAIGSDTGVNEDYVAKLVSEGKDEFINAVTDADCRRLGLCYLCKQPGHQRRSCTRTSRFRSGNYRRGGQQGRGGSRSNSRGRGRGRGGGRFRGGGGRGGRGGQRGGYVTKSYQLTRQELAAIEEGRARSEVAAIGTYAAPPQPNQAAYTAEAVYSPFSGN